MRTGRAGASAVLAAVVLSSAFVASAEAGTLSLTSDRTGDDAYSGVNGGEFKVTEFIGGTVASQGAGVRVGSDSLFQTFCLERNEVIASPSDWVINTEAVNGGYGGGNPDPLSGATAYLYTQFWNGTLSNFDYTHLGIAGRAASASSLQNAIWYLENEYTDSQFAFVADAQAAAWVKEAQAAGWNDIGGVRVLNLTVTDPGTGQILNRQDVLFLVPLPPAASMGLGLLALGGITAAIRGRRRAAASA